MQLKKSKWLLMIGAFTFLLFGAMYIHLMSGAFAMTTPEVLKTLLRIESTEQFDLVIFDFRLPRIITAALVGMGLAMAGVVLQGITKNALADPGIIGINAGAGCAIVIFMFFFQVELINVEINSILKILIVPLFGFVGGAIAAAIILAISYKQGRMDMQKLILTGIAINTGFSAITLLWSLKMDEGDYQAAAIWMNGSIYNSNWYFVCAMLPWLLILGIYIYRKSYLLDYFQLEEETITSLGISLEKEKIKLLLASVGLVSACVSVSGSIGFIGLMAPHIARQLVGIHHRYMMPVSLFIGAILLVFSDYIAKTVFSPVELSVGIVVSLVGIPYFLYLLVKSKG
ncbi:MULTISPECIES: FecCD family ABC transporter permease [Solibacillus]|uniref:Iron ABC transporter permease n=1 Tax=Solibacillus merdavium TaxID=2762218 RepID=A0ABR8XQ73_9BACL|nr:iron ABC transporter permease [Solibacillus merdavium]MBD8034037.1 iron ABC transporter permease [Solibacillus merdavium]